MRFPTNNGRSGKNGKASLHQKSRRVQEGQRTVSVDIARGAVDEKDQPSIIAFMERYSRLQPLTLDLRRKIALAAVNFFSPTNYRKMCEMVGKAADPKAIQPMSLRDFVKCLEVTRLLPEADRYQQRIRGLVERLAAADILTKMGHAGDPLFGALYYCLMEMTDQQIAERGFMALSRPWTRQFV